MKKLISLTVAISFALLCFIMKPNTTALALTPSPESDFEAFDGEIIKYIGSGGDVVIPPEIDGSTIRRISPDAFNNNNITSITIPGTITTIKYRITSSSNLKYILIPASVEVLQSVGIPPKCIIKCSAGSAAEEYAKKYGYNYEYIQPCSKHNFFTEKINVSSHKIYCIICGYDEGEAPHNFSLGSYYSVEDKNTHTLKCTDCNYAKRDSHKLSEYTYNNDKYHFAKCTICGYQIKEKHTVDYQNGTVSTPATCKAEGSGTFICTVCNTSIKATIPIDENNHTYSNWYLAQAPTETTLGIEMRVCALCAKVETRQVSESEMHTDGEESENDANNNEETIVIQEDNPPRKPIIRTLIWIGVTFAGIIVIGGITATVIIISKKKKHRKETEQISE